MTTACIPDEPEDGQSVEGDPAPYGDDAGLLREVEQKSRRSDLNIVTKSVTTFFFTEPESEHGVYDESTMAACVVKAKNDFLVAGFAAMTRIAESMARDDAEPEPFSIDTTRMGRDQ